MPACDGCETRDWWHDPTEIASLYRFLCTEGDLDPSNVDACSEVISTPWSWTDEYRQMLAWRAVHQATERRVLRPHEARS